MDRHDDHYKNLQIESIKIQEQIMKSQTIIPQEKRFLIATAVKYIMRAGLKNKDWSIDIEKAINYLHRAVTGKWID